jgi:hypothetical protein
VLKKSASGVLASPEAQRTEAYASASSLAAALLDSIFEHPARYSPIVLDIPALNFHNATVVLA